MSEIALSKRVAAPSENFPESVDGIRWRPLSPDDVDALVELNRAIATADHPNWMDSRKEIEEELSHSYMSLAVDSLAAVTEEGNIVAWGTVIFPPNQETLVRSILVGGVDPSTRGRGIGRALLAWQHGRALQQLASSCKSLPGWIVVSADERAPGSGHLIERAGFVSQRWLQNLSRTIAEPIPVVESADGIHVVRYSSEYSAAAHTARDDAFRGHGSSQQMSNEQWDSMLSLSSAAPEQSFVALDDEDRVVGLLLTLVTEEEWASRGFSSGYVWVIGVAHDSRGRGTARALIAAHLRSLGEAGIERSVLDVATDRPGEGLELYTGMGYTPQSITINYVRIY